MAVVPEDIEKRVNRLEVLHLWGGVVIVALGVLLYMKYHKHSVKV